MELGGVGSMPERLEASVDTAVKLSRPSLEPPSRGLGMATEADLFKAMPIAEALVGAIVYSVGCQLWQRAN